MQSSLESISDPALDLNNIPPFLRVLLTTDGTVTKSLEAYFWEPIQVITVQQGYVTQVQAEADLQTDIGDAVLRRKVNLVGADSQTVYASADSLVRAQLLPDTVRGGLEAGLVGIGELLREGGLETYRKLLRIGQLGHPIPAVCRSYLIFKGGEPFIKIKEVFPLGLYS